MKGEEKGLNSPFHFVGKLSGVLSCRFHSETKSGRDLNNSVIMVTTACGLPFTLNGNSLP